MSAPICRICHDEEGQEPLLSMCKCSGSMALVHVSCLERWLNTRHSDDCELCNHRFPTTAVQYSSVVIFYHWFLQSGKRTQWAAFGSLMFFTIMGLWGVLSCYYSMPAVSMQALGDHAWIIGLMVTTYVLVYTTALFVTVRCFYLSFRSWISQSPKRRRLVVPSTGRAGASHNRLPEEAASLM
ncbi:hypothetical protein V5799_023780 [Amblyomma americanum]|uniref:RING-CH-type domain-containing protein n=1 Tax=Amblyomma americanum TaxID=6943 RepID=A0AAQ4FIM2_AMBAM